MKHSKLLPIVLFGALVGCGSSANETRDTVAPDDSLARNEASAPIATAGDEVPAECQLSAVRFGYDSDELDAAARAQLDANVRCISERRFDRVRVTGTADPRGTEEYNLALGDRRAQTAAGYLESLGVENGKIERHSVGEEFASGSDESGWANDRRADIAPAQ